MRPVLSLHATAFLEDIDEQMVQTARRFFESRLYKIDCRAPHGAIACGIVQKGESQVKIRKIELVEMNCSSPLQNGSGGIHPYHEILSVLEGEVRLHWMGERFEATAPALFLIPANTPHLLLPLSESCRFGFVELEVEGELEFPSISASTDWNQTGGLNDARPECAPIRTANGQLWDSSQIAPPYSAIRSELAEYDINKLLLLIRHYSRVCRGENRDRPQTAYVRTETRERLQEAMRRMEACYHQPLSIRDLAIAANMENNYFIRAFRSLCGKTPLQYLHELRFSAALCYLSTTAMSVQRIAEASGFQSIHYFSRFFKQRYGVSPAVWRKENRFTA